MSTPGSAAHQVRLLIADLDDTRPVLSDDEIAGYLGLHGVTPEQAGVAPTTVPIGRVRLAAADALDAIATSEVLVSKVIRTQDGLSTDGAKVSAELRARAASLRELAAETPALDDDDTGFDVLEFSPYPRGGW